jgi:Flp pilus assembly protein TadB
MIQIIISSNFLGGIFGFLFVLSAILLIVFLLKKKKRKQIGKRNIENKELNQPQTQSQYETKSQSQYESKLQSISQSNQNFPEPQYSQSVEPQQSQNSERRESTIVLMKTLVPTKVCYSFQIITQSI